MNGPDIWNWLISSSGAGWIIGMISTIYTLYLFFSRKHPSIILITEEENISLVQVYPEFENFIKVNFNKKNVKSLSQIRLEISNIGTETIKDSRIMIEFPLATQVLYSHTDWRSKKIGSKSEIKKNRFIFSLPFLNSLKDHHQKIFLTIIVDGESNFIATGMGDGWSVKTNYLESTKKQVRFLSWFVFGLIPFEFFYYKFIIESIFKINANEFSLRVILITMPMIIPVIFIYYYFFKHLWRSRFFRSIIRYSITNKLKF